MWALRLKLVFPPRILLKGRGKGMYKAYYTLYSLLVVSHLLAHVIVMITLRDKNYLSPYRGDEIEALSIVKLTKDLLKC